MTTTPKITIEDLALKLKGKMWVKDDLKRIYLDRGHNTKKMSTKTYVFEKDGDFIVVCNIECSSQPWQWIKSQQDEVIESVENDIFEIIRLTKVELIESRLSEDETEVEVRISFDGKIEDKFLTESEFDERFNRYPQSVFDNLPKTKQLEKIDLFPVSKPVSETLAESAEEQDVKAKIYELGSGKKVKHNRFGLGEIIEEIDGGEKLKILFETEGEKQLLARFANLTYL